jgi:catechol 2,3-dioxygenase-like lactoylglutathione lyase family enzyme
VLDHLGITVRDLGVSKAFYLAALAPLGYELLMEPIEGVSGFGMGGKPDFWLREGESAGQVHVAFSRDDRSAVDAFHEAALAAGGRDNGGPGVREIYHPQYYGAFVLDPDGNNVEAVCHRPA